VGLGRRKVRWRQFAKDKSDECSDLPLEVQPVSGLYARHPAATSGAFRVWNRHDPSQLHGSGRNLACDDEASPLDGE